MTAPRRDHGVAQAAWTAVTAVEDGKFSQYRSRVMELPVMLRTSGSLAALAYLASKGDVHEIVAKQLAAHVGPVVGIAGTATPWMVIAALTDGSPAMQGRTEEAARMYADWLKRSVESRRHQMAGPPKKDSAGA